MPNKTALYEVHRKLGATMADFHGWLLPLYYTTPVAEHNAVREKCGLFDVSHMGEIMVEGKDAKQLIQRVVVRDIAGMQQGEMRLAVMCNENGGILDDLTVYKFSAEKFWLVVNAAPYENDLRWVQKHGKGMNVRVRGLRKHTAKLDLQGPKAEAVLQQLSGKDLREISYYNFGEIKVAEAECVASRSGYTGEDGFELYFDAGNAEKVWSGLAEAGKRFGLVPCGLAARDTLRLEAGVLLYGQDIDSGHSILQCPYEKIVSWGKEFVGKKELLKQRQAGIKEKLVGFELIGRGIARHGSKILCNGKNAGVVTSGSFAPTLKKSIGFCYISAALGAAGAEFEVDIRGRKVRAKVVEMPFYRRCID